MSLRVGSECVAQQIPFADTAEPPSEVTFPPEIAVVIVIEVTAVVVTVAGSPFLLHEIKRELKTSIVIKIFFIQKSVYNITNYRLSQLSDTFAFRLIPFAFA